MDLGSCGRGCVRRGGVSAYFAGEVPGTEKGTGSAAYDLRLSNPQPGRGGGHGRGREKNVRMRRRGGGASHRSSKRKAVARWPSICAICLLHISYFFCMR
eukprot:scaffold21872_cov112-Isochrysis_galbana.AAC.2